MRGSEREIIREKKKRMRKGMIERGKEKDIDGVKEKERKREMELNTKTFNDRERREREIIIRERGIEREKDR